MSATWTPEQVLALAPDASSAKNGKALATPHKWVSLGYNDQAVWGECQGSGKNPYRTQIDLTETAFKCSCPSRKLPCKHGLGLFLLRSSQSAAFTENTPPDWVNEWLSARSQKQAKKTETTEKAVDTAAQAKRAQQRLSKVTAGMQDLELWLRDLVRQGLAVAQTQPYSFWDAAAARLVDAQAPGVARLVREMASIPHSGTGWQEKLLARLGRVYLLVEGFKRWEALAADVQADIRSQIGWTQIQEELLKKEGVQDSWLILGQRVEEQDRLRVQRLWLWGKQSQQAALILNFAYGSQPLETSLIPGTIVDAEIVFFESAYPLRGIVKTRSDATTQIGGMPGYSKISAMLQAYAKATARNPWIEQFPVALSAVVPIHYQGNWLVSDAAGHQLPLIPRFQQGWQLLALSGGHPLGLFGEWDGEYFLPLSAWSENQFHHLSI